jgi:hypothetical protein
MDEISSILVDLNSIRERFAKIQENPSLYGPENGFTNEQLETLEKIISQVGEASIAGNEITKRHLS